MKKISITDRIPFCYPAVRLGLVVLSLVLGVSRASADGMSFMQITRIEGFSALTKTRDMEAASISDSASTGISGRARLAWGQERLEDLKTIQMSDSGEMFLQLEDVFAFRDWCVMAPGKGNLILAIAAEETAADLLFRALAETPARGDEVRRSFSRCLPNGLPADYWLEILAMEGIVVDCGDALRASEPEYVRMGTVLETLDSALGGWDNPLRAPKAGGAWNGCTDAFAPVQLAMRTMMIARKEIALEACLDIYEGNGFIPDERYEFIRAANKYADRTMRNRNRFTDYAVSDEVWDYWAAVLAGKK